MHRRVDPCFVIGTDRLSFATLDPLISLIWLDRCKALLLLRSPSPSPPLLLLLLHLLLDVQGSNHGSNFTRRGSGLEGRTLWPYKEVSLQPTSGRWAGPRAGGAVSEEQMPLKGTNGRIKPSGDGAYLDKDKGCEAWHDLCGRIVSIIRASVVGT